MNSDQTLQSCGWGHIQMWLIPTKVFKVNKMIYWLETDKKPHNLETESYTQGAYCQHIENTI